MRAIIGKSAVVPHIKRVRIIEAVVPIVDGILRHLVLLIVSSAQEGSWGVWWDDDIPGNGRKKSLV